MFHIKLSILLMICVQCQYVLCGCRIQDRKECESICRNSLGCELRIAVILPNSSDIEASLMRVSSKEFVSSKRISIFCFIYIYILNSQPFGVSRECWIGIMMNGKFKNLWRDFFSYKFNIPFWLNELQILSKYEKQRKNYTLKIFGNSRVLCSNSRFSIYLNIYLLELLNSSADLWVLNFKILESEKFSGLIFDE